ncbi:MAG: 2-hydroxyacyl-CoA dehydratase family protein [Chloroflexota bacterium]
METVLAKFRAAAQQPYPSLADTKKHGGRPVIGCLPMYIPEEMVHAAGMLPVVLLGDDQPITAANEHIQTNTCEVVRGTLDLAVRGGLDCLDGIVFSDICDPVQYLSGIWKLVHPFPYFHVLDIPHKLDGTGRDYLLTVWQRFRTSLEDLNGRKIGDDALRQSIALYNRNRALLRQIYQWRRANPGLISANDIAAVVRAGMVMPREEHNRWLTELLAQAKKKPKAAAGNQVKLFLAGTLCAEPHREILRLVEELGGVIVDDEIYVGARYFATDVAEGGDPMAALADHYGQRWPCTTMHYPEIYPRQGDGGQRDYTRSLIEMYRQSGARGIIMLIVLFCDPYSFNYPTIKERLAAAGVPALMMETEHQMGAMEQVRTRLQAFIEMLKG